MLEAGSAAGALVFPPLAPHEAFQVGYQGEGRYRFAYYLNPTGSRWETIFTVTFALPAGAVGAIQEDVEFAIADGPVSREHALLTTRMFIAVDDLGTPAGAVTLRGSWGFRTPEGWDTIYTPVFNVVERPVAPMLVVRVETDWYVHDSEFRYVLQAGEALSASHALPIGQALFVSREDVEFGECDSEELASLQQARDEFARAKGALRRTSAFGLEYSPHYAKLKRGR